MHKHDCVIILLIKISVKQFYEDFNVTFMSIMNEWMIDVEERKGQGVWSLSQYASAEGGETPWTISKTATGIIKVDKHINTLIYT